MPNTATTATAVATAAAVTERQWLLRHARLRLAAAREAMAAGNLPRARLLYDGAMAKRQLARCV